MENRGADSLGEMRELMERFDDATSALDDALREDFRSMPRKAQERMRELLARAGEAGMEMLGILDAG